MSKVTSHNIAALLLGMLLMVTLANIVLLGALIYLDTQHDTAPGTTMACNLSAFEYEGSIYLHSDCADSDTVERLPKLTEYTQ